MSAIKVTYAFAYHCDRRKKTFHDGLTGIGVQFPANNCRNFDGFLSGVIHEDVYKRTNMSIKVDFVKKNT